MKSKIPIGIVFLCLGFFISGLIFIPFTIGALGSYRPGTSISSNAGQLATLMLVLVLIPLFLAYSLWNGYRFSWYLAVVFAAFYIFLYLVTFASLNITISNGPIVSNSALGALSYAVAYGIVYIGAYLLAIIEVLINICLLYYLSRGKTRQFFGL